MKTSTIIRFVLAALLATLACIGILFGVTGIPVLWAVAWLLLMGRAELTKPIPHKELWVGIVVFIIFIGLIVVLDILHLPEPHGIIRTIFAIAMWILWMFAVYVRWRKEKGKADA